MSLWIKQNTAVTLKIGPFLDSTDGVTSETALTISQADVRLTKNGAAYAQKNDATAATHNEAGWYDCPLNATDTNTLGILQLQVVESGALPVWHQYMVAPANVWDSLFGADKLQVHADEITAGLITAAAIATDAIDADALAANAIDAAVIATGAITAAKFAAGAIDAAAIADNAIDANTFAAGAITATAIATGAIDADALAADALAELRGALVAGTADSGTTTTMVDAALTQTDADYWKGALLLFTSGNIAGQCRLITGFTPGTDTITFAPATTQAVTTQTYEILAAGPVNVRQWLETTVNALISGRVDVSVQAVANDVITAAAIANGAIDAATFAPGAIDATAIATDAITATKIAADALGASELAADAVTEIRNAILSDGTPFAGANLDATISSRATPAQVNAEVLDVLNVDTFAEIGQETPAATQTMRKMLSYLYKFMRNRITTTGSTISVYNDDGTTVGHKSTHSDNGTVYDRGEFTTGP